MSDLFDDIYVPQAHVAERILEEEESREPRDGRREDGTMAETRDQAEREETDGAERWAGASSGR